MAELLEELRRLREMVPGEGLDPDAASRLQRVMSESEHRLSQLESTQRENQLLRLSLRESELQLREKIEEISLLRLIADMETSMFSARDPFEIILSQVLTLTGAENGSIMLLDRPSGVVSLKSAVSVRKHYEKTQLSFRLGEGIAGRVVDSGEAMLVPDVLEESAFVPLDRLGPSIRSLFCLPLKVDKVVLGVINISHSLAGAFNQDTERAMHVISRYLAMALRSADLIERQREHIRLIEASENRYRTLVESVNDGFFIVDAAGRTRLVNEQFTRIVEYSKDEILAMESWQGIVLPSDWDRVAATFASYGRESADVQHSLEFGMVSRSHREVPVYLRCRGMTLEYGPCYIGVVRDMTEFRTMQSRLLQSEKLAGLGTLLTGITHELNNKLTPILGYSQLMQESALSEKDRGYLEAVEACATGAKAIVDSLLGFTRRSSLAREPIRLGDLIHGVHLLTRSTLEHSHILVEMFLDEAQPLALGSPHQLEQVLLNIINNAIQAMEPMGGGVLTITSGSSKETVWISIADTGPGIAPEVLPRIFDPFFTTRGDKKGTGLGLSVSYGIVQAHGGELRVQTTVGQGTRFILELPVLQEGPAKETASTGGTSAAPRRPIRILVVDDEEMIGELIQEMLTDHRVEVVHDGYLAQQRLAQQDYDLVMLDMRMPILDGPALYSWLCEIDPARGRRVIFTTGDTYDPATESFLKESGRPCLSKPFTVDELRRCVADFLRERWTG